METIPIIYVFNVVLILGIGILTIIILSMAMITKSNKSHQLDISRKIAAIFIFFLLLSLLLTLVFTSYFSVTVSAKETSYNDDVYQSIDKSIERIDLLLYSNSNIDKKEHAELSSIKHELERTKIEMQALSYKTSSYNNRPYTYKLLFFPLGY
jgi:nitrogen fixation/metabolism regulation signal transduction histidine kinase